MERGLCLEKCDMGKCVTRAGGNFPIEKIEKIKNVKT